MRARSDIGSGRKNYHSIIFCSGWASSFNPDSLGAPPYMSGLTSEQLAWMKEDQKQAYNNGKNHTFVFTHAPIVGHGGDATHDVPLYDGEEFAFLVDHDRPFVEWVNGDDSDYPEGNHIEAVFVGHTHENHIFYDVDSYNMYHDTPEKSNPSDLKLLYFSRSSYYIETDTATKEG